MTLLGARATKSSKVGCVIRHGALRCSEETGLKGSTYCLLFGFPIMSLCWRSYLGWALRVVPPALSGGSNLCFTLPASLYEARTRSPSE